MFYLIEPNAQRDVNELKKADDGNLFEGPSLFAEVSDCAYISEQKVNGVGLDKVINILLDVGQRSLNLSSGEVITK